MGGQGHNQERELKKKKNGKNGNSGQGTGDRAAIPSTAGLVSQYNENNAGTGLRGTDRVTGSAGDTVQLGMEANVPPTGTLYDLEVVMSYGTDIDPAFLTWDLFDMTQDKLVLWPQYAQAKTPGAVVVTRAERVLAGNYRLVLTNSLRQGLGNGWVKIVDASGYEEGETNLELDGANASFAYTGGNAFKSLVILDFAFP